MTVAALPVDPDIDKYGPYARASALADFLEVAAIANRRITQAALQDLIVENEWVKRPKRQFLAPDDVQEDPETWAVAVFNTMLEREENLGDAYPFVQRGNALRWRDRNLSPRDSGYVALLAVTVVHAWDLPTSGSPEATLEAVVVSALRAKGMTATGIGATERGMGFKEAVQSGGIALGLRPTEDPRPRSRRAKDAGVDTLAGVVWRDSRPAGQWVMIGQATVAKSQEWKIKLTQPEPARWARFLNEPLLPQPFLAVPHHVEEEHLVDLLAAQRGLILDRLRLVADKPSNSSAEIALIDDMMAAGVTT